MPPTENATSENKLQIELLKKDHQFLNEIVTKMDVSVEKIADATSNIQKLLALNEQKVNAVQEDMAYFRNSIITYFEKFDAARLEAKRQVDDEIANVKKDIKELEERVDSLEKWRYIIGGITVAIYFILDHGDTIVGWLK
jgi:uncharacterized protein Yka (UPF0111/DUF47 family)